MEKEFVTYGLAVKLKVIGFDKPSPTFYTAKGILYRSIDFNGYTTDKLYTNECLAPTFSQAFRWLRENHQWTIKVNQVTKNNWSYTLENFPNDRTYYGEVYKSFEVAEIGCLEKLISFIEREK
jgi:uncharacterized membrane protein